MRPRLQCMWWPPWCAQWARNRFLISTVCGPKFTEFWRCVTETLRGWFIPVFALRRPTAHSFWKYSRFIIVVKPFKNIGCRVSGMTKFVWVPFCESPCKQVTDWQKLRKCEIIQTATRSQLFVNIIKTRQCSSYIFLFFMVLSSLEKVSECVSIFCPLPGF